MTGDPITVTAVSGLATWAQSVDPIVHTVEATGLTLTASTVLFSDIISNPFDIVQGPFFNTPYPFADSTRFLGFHLNVNASEQSTVYYDVRPSILPAPSVDDIIAGNGSVTGQLFLDTPDLTYIIVVSDPALTDLFSYNAYLVLQNGLGERSERSDLLGIRTSDSDTKVNDAVTQITSTSIPSTADTPAEAVDVWSFVIRDGGSNDGAPTYVTELTINQGPSMSGKDYTEIIEGVTLKDSVGNLIPISTQTILATNIEIVLDAGDLTIPDGGFRACRYISLRYAV
jgi:hypothetical protein